jgi:hypothetical protein
MRPCGSDEANPLLLDRGAKASLGWQELHAALKLLRWQLVSSVQ